MRNKQFAALAIMLGIGLMVSRANAAVLAQYQFGVTGQETTDETSAVFNPTVVFPGLTVSRITDPNNTIGLESSSAATIPANAPFLRIDPQGNSADPNAAQTNNKYFQFAISAFSGNEVSLNSLTFDVERGGGGTPRGFFVRSSLDNFGSIIAVTGVPALSANATNPIGNDINTARPSYTAVTGDLSAFQHIQNLPDGTVTFRIYAYSPAAGSSVDFDNITINGTATGVPEPASISLAALGALLLRRSRRVL